jgi:hypothetical protein
MRKAQFHHKSKNVQFNDIYQVLGMGDILKITIYYTLRAFFTYEQNISISGSNCENKNELNRCNIFSDGPE